MITRDTNVSTGHYPKLQLIQSDLISLLKRRRYDVVLFHHNCFHTPDNRLASRLFRLFPEMAARDRRTKPADVQKLGSILDLEVNWHNRRFRLICLYTQFAYGSDERRGIVTGVDQANRIGSHLDRSEHTDPMALQLALHQVHQYYGQRQLKFLLPALGSPPYGDAPWEQVQAILGTFLGNEETTIVRPAPHLSLVK